MSKPYPQNRSIGARLECLCDSHNRMHNLLEVLVTVNEDTKQLPPAVISRIKEAIAKAALAVQAVIGDDPQ